MRKHGAQQQQRAINMALAANKAAMWRSRRCSRARHARLRSAGITIKRIAAALGGNISARHQARWHSNGARQPEKYRAGGNGGEKSGGSGGGRRRMAA